MGSKGESVVPASATVSSDQSLSIGTVTKAPPPGLLGYKTREEFETATTGSGTATYNGHYYATSGQKVTNYGVLGTFSLYAPVATASSWSGIQIACGNSQTGQLQAVEAGFHVNRALYGDDKLHLYTYFTTTGYTREGQVGYLGGYNRAAGFTVSDGSGTSGHQPAYVPGMAIAQLSELGGEEVELELKWRLHGRNWWLEVNGSPVGYYHQAFFEQAGANSLADFADAVAVWGEVYDPDNTPPITQMGSGRPAGYGKGYAVSVTDAYINTGDGVAQKYVGSVWATEPRLYSIDAHFDDPGIPGEGSTLFIGGPGRRDWSEDAGKAADALD